MNKNRDSLLAEIWQFRKARKAWWLVPTIVVLIAISWLFIASQSAAVSPFIYVLF
ncbi:MAG: DUF5989 family protein [Patescibacteria group bacterium]|mgnify:FL=1